MPSVKKGEKQSDYMHRCVPMLVKEGKKQDQAVAQCLGMFREHWKAKGSELPEDPNSEEFREALADFMWDDCPECIKLESDLNKKRGIFEIDMSVAKVTTKCDNCKETIDTSKPKPTKGKDGKAQPAKPNPAIQAVLETGLDTGETKQYHFCDEECLRQYLNKRSKT
jgi:hypothetical protein